MGYTHLVGDDDRRVVEQLDDLFCPLPKNQTEGRVWSDAKFAAGIL